MVRQRGMLPGEYMRRSLIEVWPESPISIEPGFEGREVATGEQIAGTKELRPDYYVTIVRRSPTGQFHYEVLKAQPHETSDIPAEVFDRMVQLRDRIIKQQRSERSRDTALARKADGHIPFQRKDDNLDAQPDG